MNNIPVIIEEDKAEINKSAKAVHATEFTTGAGIVAEFQENKARGPSEHAPIPDDNVMTIEFNGVKITSTIPYRGLRKHHIRISRNPSLAENEPPRISIFTDENENRLSASRAFPYNTKSAKITVDIRNSKIIYIEFFDSQEKSIDKYRVAFDRKDFINKTKTSEIELTDKSQRQ